jgi:glucose-1-phosphate thymidylyltransferase
MKGLLLAGGHGTRLRPLTFTGNKHMIPIANQPMLFYGLRHLAEGGIREVGIVLGPLHEGIEEAVGNGESFGLHVTYIHQGDPKGLAHAVLCAEEFLGDEPFVMYLGDNLLQEGTRAFIRQFQENDCDAVVGVTPVSNPSSYGIAEVKGDQLVSVMEKPTVPRSNLALIGVYVFSPRIHAVIRKLHPSGRGELEITDAIWKLHEKRHAVTVRHVKGWWKDTGHPDDLLEANELVLKTMPARDFGNDGTVQPGAKVEGSIAIGARTVVETGAQVTGPTVLGSDVRIGPGSRVGPFTSIGNRVVVNRSQIRRSIVMDHSIIEGVRLTDSLVGRNAELRAKHLFDEDVLVILGDSSKVTW